MLPSKMARKIFKRAQRDITDLVMTGIGTVTHVVTHEPVAALTFDDGPHPRYTPSLLDILDRHQVKATFFMVGEAARRYPELVRQAAEAGHAIGNHSWDHQSFALIGRTERIRQLRACESALRPYGCKLFRPPHGHQNMGSLLDAAALGYQTVTWNVAGEDWNEHDAAFISDKITGDTRAGSLILLHDAMFNHEEGRYAGRETTLSAVENILQRLGGAFTFVTVPELFRYGRRKKVAWYRVPDGTSAKKIQNLRRGEYVS